MRSYGRPEIYTVNVVAGRYYTLHNFSLLSAAHRSTLSCKLMTKKLNFASDNASGAHEKVIDAITRANLGSAAAYGGDAYSNQVANKMRTAFDAEAEIFFTFGGTGANVMALGSITRSFEAIFCSDCSHIWSDECAAPQKFFGGKIIPLPSKAGKISPRDIEAGFGPERGVHHALPRVVSITQPTEVGTIYSLEEMQALSDFCTDRDLLLHVDGARFSNAAAALKVSLARLSHQAGIDVLSFGGTKNGAIGAEAVIYFNTDLAEHAGYARKQATQLASKMRFIAAQFDALFTDDLWLENATHANTMAALLADEASKCGVEFTETPQINALFPILSPNLIDQLQADCDFYVWDVRRSVARWMTSFNTSKADVLAFSDLIKQSGVSQNS